VVQLSFFYLKITVDVQFESCVKADLRYFCFSCEHLMFDTSSILHLYLIGVIALTNSHGVHCAPTKLTYSILIHEI